MAKINILKNNFSLGEVTPRLWGRSDTPTFQNGAATIENYYAILGGGLKSRPGTAFCAEVKDSTKSSRVIPFVYSVLTSYVIEAGAGYMRFYKDNARIDNTYAAWLTGTAYKIGDLVTDSGNYYRCLVAHTSGTFATDLAAVKWVLTAGATDTAYEIPTTYLEAELFDIDYCQENNVIYLVHPLHPPATLTCTGDTAWALANISFTAAPADWTTNNYPKSVTLYQQRLVFGGTDTSPQKIWGSKSGSRTDMALGSLDTDGYAFTISADTVAPIIYLSSAKTIVAHTYLGEYTIEGGNDTALTPSNVQIALRSSFGSAFVKPIKIANQTFFVQRAGTRVRAFEYKFDIDAYEAPDTAAFASHITQYGIIEMFYAQEPESLLYAVLGNGVIGVMSYDVKNGLQGWARFVTSGYYKSVCCIPKPAEDQVWCIVQRGTKRFVEYFVQGTNTDSHVVQTGAAATVWSGYDHLEGLSVDILADGSPQPHQDVASGDITLVRNATAVEAGLPYTSTMLDLPVEVAGGGIGQTAQGSKLSCNEVTVRFFETKTATINGNTQTFRKFGSSVLDTAVAAFTGDVDHTIIQGWTDRGQITITRTEPLDQTIIGIYKKVSVND